MASEISNLGESHKLRLFGKFTLDSEKKVLWLGGKPVSLPLKAVEILCVLTANPGELVTKDEIVAAVWRDTFVEESNLTNNISLLRKTFKTLGEENLIDTIPGRGYRFTGMVQDVYERDEITIERRAVSQTLVEEIPASGSGALPPAREIGNRARFWRPAFVLAALALAVIACVGIWFWTRSPERVSISDIQAIAVLPLRSFDENVVDENLRLRMMDAMITKLGNLESVSVRPTSSTMRFINTSENPIEIGRRLEVDAVLEGSVHRENNRVRITLQLVSVSSGAQVWSDQFDGDAENLLDLESAVSAKLVAILDPRLSSAQRAAFDRRPTTNSEAYEEYLKGRYLWNKRSPESLQSAISAFETAIKLDPDFALAHAGLADVYCVLPEYTGFAEKDSYALAETHAVRALKLNENLAEAHTSLAFVEFWYKKDFAGAEKSFRRAIEANPNYPTAHHWFANVLLANNAVPEALKQMKDAQKLDPLSLVINTELGILYYYARDYAAAETQFKRTLGIEPYFYRAILWLARVLTAEAKYQDALALYRTIPVDIAERDGVVAELGLTKALSGDRAGAETDLKTLTARSGTEKNAFSSAIISLGLGNYDRSIEYLKKAATERESDLAYLNIDPIFDPLRDIPEFKRLAERYR